MEGLDVGLLVLCQLVDMQPLWAGWWATSAILEQLRFRFRLRLFAGSTVVDGDGSDDVAVVEWRVQSEYKVVTSWWEV